MRKKIYYVPQNSFLLPFSIKENITMGELIAEEKWNELLRQEFMIKFLNQGKGLDEIIYEFGSNLSRGDRQKIILARIFLQNPDVIILDESFNALDEKLGDEILKTILEIYSNKIVIMISHSDKYLKYCNKKYIIREKILLEST